MTTGKCHGCERHIPADFGFCSICTEQAHLEGGGLITDLAEQPEGARFHVDRVITTGGAAAALADARQAAAGFVARHASGDWGKVGHFDWTMAPGVYSEDDDTEDYDEDADQNRIAILQGTGQVHSVFSTSKGVELWVITTLGSNGETHVLLPDEY